MEAFMTTLPPFVHEYLNRYPPTEWFSVLKDLICFGVLYANDRERINLLTTQLLAHGADQAIVHKPYTSPTSTLPSSAASSPRNMKPLSSSASMHIKPIMEEEMLATTPDLLPASPTHEVASVSSIASSHHAGSTSNKHQQHQNQQQNQPLTSNGANHVATASKSPSTGNMPYTFPDWWAHPDDTPPQQQQNQPHQQQPSYQQQTQPQNDPVTTTQGKVTPPVSQSLFFIPMDNEDKPKPVARARPVSMYSPTIPDLRSYLDVKPSVSSSTKKGPADKVKQEVQASTKASRRMSAPPVNNQPPPRPASVAASPIMSPTSPKPPPSPLSRSSSTLSNRSASILRPGQTATVRARAEQARQRQWQLEEEKRKAQQQKEAASRTSQRLKQQVSSGIDWDSIKRTRRQTLAGPLP
ncbi:hypothetical protein BC940DRAFT_74434 [Gongronella butleri]|nr:hypothetical protein BC940DRAFT_74434 [Gongronella butleri]